MVSGLIAALAALFATLFALAAPDSTPRDKVPAPSTAEDTNLDQRVDDLRTSIRAWVDESLARAGIEEPPAPLPDLDQSPAESSPSRLTPSTDDEDCETREASGEGWARSLVRCIQQSTDGSSSSVVSSSSNVTVQGTSSDDTP